MKGSRRRRSAVISRKCPTSPDHAPDRRDFLLGMSTGSIHKSGITRRKRSLNETHQGCGQYDGGVVHQEFDMGSSQRLPPRRRRRDRKCILNEVTTGIANATVVLISQRYRETAQPSNENATCNITGSDSIALSKYQLRTPSIFRCRLWLCSQTT